MTITTENHAPKREQWTTEINRSSFGVASTWRGTSSRCQKDDSPQKPDNCTTQQPDNGAIKTTTTTMLNNPSPMYKKETHRK